MRVSVIWVTAVAAIVAGLASIILSALAFSASRYGPGPITATGHDWGSTLSVLGTPLLSAGLLGIIVAITTHALLWRRAHVSPRRPEPSP